MLVTGSGTGGRAREAEAEKQDITAWELGNL